MAFGKALNQIVVRRTIDTRIHITQQIRDYRGIDRVVVKTATEGGIDDKYRKFIIFSSSEGRNECIVNQELNQREGNLIVWCWC